eukprot:m.252640 g.252640  ORF g.252640 m.252640 type:complete len:62 (-) comp17922_c0_seq1:223-408(-)
MQCCREQGVPCDGRVCEAQAGIHLYCPAVAAMTIRAGIAQRVELCAPISFVIFGVGHVLWA